MEIHEKYLIDSGEELSGLDITLSTMTKQGQIIDTFDAAHFLIYEGYAKKRSSVFSGDLLEVCDQTIELYRYSENGDIIGKLSPYHKGACRTTRYLIEDGTFKKTDTKPDDNTQ